MRWASEFIENILGRKKQQESPVSQCEECPYALFHNSALKCTGLFSETATTYPDNAELIQRIVTFYNLCHENTKISQASLWNYIIEMKNDVHSALLKDYSHPNTNDATHSQVAQILSDPVNSEFWYGFSEPTKSRYQSRQDCTKISWEYDVLYRLAQAWGCLPMSNPESKFPNEYPSVEDILSCLDQVFGQSIPVPNNYPHIVGLKTSRGILDYRAINGLYCAKKLHDFGATRVLELGAGLGWSAYYANQLGIKDYTIIDVPMTCIASAHFLGAALGADAISLGTEQVTPQTQVTILPPENFHANTQYDVVLNIDSLTEMGEDVAREYCEKIKKICRRFISINHEYHTYTVAKLFAGDDCVKHSTRNPYWLRRGYVEEIFDFK